MWDLGLTVSKGQFGRLCRQVYGKVSKQANMQVSGSSQVHRLIGLINEMQQTLIKVKPSSSWS